MPLERGAQASSGLLGAGWLGDDDDVEPGELVLPVAKRLSNLSPNSIAHRCAG